MSDERMEQNRQPEKTDVVFFSPEMLRLADQHRREQQPWERQREQPEPWVRREQRELQREQRLRRSPQRKRCNQRH